MLQVLVVLGHNITGNDVTVLARAEGQYIDAQVRAQHGSRLSITAAVGLCCCMWIVGVCVCHCEVHAVQVPALISIAYSDSSHVCLNIATGAAVGHGNDGCRQGGGRGAGSAAAARWRGCWAATRGDPARCAPPPPPYIVGHVQQSSPRFTDPMGC